MQEELDSQNLISQPQATYNPDTSLNTDSTQIKNKMEAQQNKLKVSTQYLKLWGGSFTLLSLLSLIIGIVYVSSKR
jgi:hypothetical protein